MKEGDIVWAQDWPLRITGKHIHRDKVKGPTWRRAVLVDFCAGTWVVRWENTNTYSPDHHRPEDLRTDEEHTKHMLLQ